MKLAIRWTKEAEETFDYIIKYLQEKWSAKQVQEFVRIVNNVLKQISEFPHMYKASRSNPNIRKGFIGKQCSLFYEIQNETVVLLFFWDNRRKPLSNN